MDQIFGMFSNKHNMCVVYCKTYLLMIVTGPFAPDVNKAVVKARI